jgi:hypothetical protein
MRSLAALEESAWAACWGTVYGAVYLGGRVWGHEFGWRAEHARIACLISPQMQTVNRDRIRCLADYYGVPVLSREEATQWPR